MKSAVFWIFVAGGNFARLCDALFRRAGVVELVWFVVLTAYASRVGWRRLKVLTPHSGRVKM